MAIEDPDYVDPWEKTRSKSLSRVLIKVIAFDCFGTIFDMSGIPKDEIAAYVKHVKADDFSPYQFPESWWELKAFDDCAVGIEQLRELGFKCVTLSNSEASLLRYISTRAGIKWDAIINLAGHRVYKPHLDAYRTVQAETGFPPSETMMVTANPTFGDVEGSAAIGMTPQIIRRTGYPKDILELARIMGA